MLAPMAADFTTSFASGEHSLLDKRTETDAVVLSYLPKKAVATCSAVPPTCGCTCVPNIRIGVKVAEETLVYREVSIGQPAIGFFTPAK